MLALTFSRKAAEQLRDRVTARLGRTMATTLSSTFHSFAYGLVRRYSTAELYAAPLRLLSRARAGRRAPGAARGQPGGRSCGRAALDAGRGDPRLRAGGAGRPRPGPREGPGPPRPQAAGGGLRRAGAGRGGPVHAAVPGHPRRPELHRLPRADLPRGAAGRAAGDPGGPAGPVRARVRRRVPGHRPEPGAAAARPRRRRARPHRGGGPGPVDLRVPRRRGARHPGLPAGRSRSATAAARTPWRCGSPGASGPGCCGSPGRSRPGLATTGSIDAETFEAFRQPEARSGLVRRRPRRRAAPSTPSAPRPSTSPTCCAARTSRTASPGPRWRCWSARAAPASRGSGGRWARPACRSRWPATTPRWSRSRPCCRCSTRSGRSSTSTTTTRPTSTTSAPTGPRRCSVSPLGGLDATEVRPSPGRCGPGRSARCDPRPRRPVAAHGRPSCSASALLRPRLLDGVRDRGAAKALALATLLQRSRVLLDDGATAEEVLWQLWSGTDWPRRLRRGVDLGGQAARLAHRDLDAICALFEVAARAEEQRGHTSVRSFLDVAARPADPGRHAGRARRARARPCGCSPPTGPRASSGGSWWSRTSRRRAGPTCGAGPRCCRPTGSGADGLLPAAESSGAARRGAPAVLRRLHPRPRAAAGHRGRVPRGRRRAAVAVPRRARRRPSPTHRPGPPAAAAVPRRPGRRAAPHRRRPRAPRAAAPRPPPPGWRVLAATERRGRPLVPAADPANWWGPAARSRCDVPVRPPDEPLRLSASAARGAAHLPGQVVPRARGRGRDAAPASPRASARRARARRPDRQGRARRRTPSTGRRPDGARRPGLGPARRSAPRGRARASARRSRAALTRFLDWHTAPGRAHRAGHRAAAHRGGRPCPTASRSRLTGTPTASSSTRTAASWSIDLKTTKYPPTDKDLAGEPAARPLPARRRPTAPSTSSSPAAPGVRAAPSWSSCASAAHRREGPARRSRRTPTPRAAPTIEVQLMRGGRRGPRRGVRRDQPGKHCERCDFQRSARPRPPGRCCRDRVRRPRPRRDTPEQLRAADGAGSRSATSSSPPITAPLEPAVVIAGAGSGQDHRDGGAGRLAGRHRAGRGRPRCSA